MSYDLQKLRGIEILTFLELRKKYKGYDKVDLLVHKTLKIVGVPKEEFISREVKEKKKKEVIAIQQEGDEINRFCDGDSCEVPVFINKKC